MASSTFTDFIGWVFSSKRFSISWRFAELWERLKSSWTRGWSGIILRAVIPISQKTHHSEYKSPRSQTKGVVSMFPKKTLWDTMGIIRSRFAASIDATVCCQFVCSVYRRMSYRIYSAGIVFWFRAFFSLSMCSCMRLYSITHVHYACNRVYVWREWSKNRVVGSQISRKTGLRVGSIKKKFSLVRPHTRQQIIPAVNKPRSK